MANEVYTLITIIFGAFLGISLIYAIFNRQKNPKLSVIVKIDPNNKDDKLILIEVANIGKRPVTIIDYGFKLKIKIPVTTMDYGIWSNIDKEAYFPTSNDAKLPIKLQKGHKHSFKMYKSDLMEKLINQKPKTIIPISAWVKDNNGKIHESINIKEHFPEVYNIFKN